MPREGHKETILRAIDEALNKGNLAVADSMFAPGYIFHAADGSQFEGLEGWKQYISTVRAAFPDIHCIEEGIACEGDTLAVHLRFTATHSGPLGGMPGTGRKVTMQEALFFRFEGEKLVEEWQFTNHLALLQQLGAAPPMPRPSG